MSKNLLINHLTTLGKNLSWSELAAKYNISSGDAARSIWRRNKEILQDSFVINIVDEIESIIDNEKGESQVKFTSSSNCLSDEEIYKECRVDSTKWILTQIWHKKTLNGFNYSAKFKLKEASQKDYLLEFLKNYKSSYKPIDKVILNKTDKSKNCLLLSLPDFHLDKLVISNNDVGKHIQNYETILEKILIKSCSSYLIDEIVFVIGNDFFHTDSSNNTTTKGTPLQVTIDWDLAYEKGFDLMIRSISKIKQFCNKLNIILVQGNHPSNKEFYLTHALEVYFKPDKNISFNRSKSNLKVHQYGETLFCFNHGNNINDKLPLAFATSFHKEWGACKYKEIILGDKHHNSEKMIKFQGETNGVRMRILPALCGTDTWHQDNLFINAIQAGIGLIYDVEKGKVGEFEERL